MSATVRPSVAAGGSMPLIRKSFSASQRSKAAVPSGVRLDAAEIAVFVPDLFAPAASLMLKPRQPGAGLAAASRRAFTARGGRVELPLCSACDQ